MASAKVSLLLGDMKPCEYHDFALDFNLVERTLSLNIPSNAAGCLEKGLSAPYIILL
jgi:hypothetical protein